MNTMITMNGRGGGMRGGHRGGRGYGGRGGNRGRGYNRGPRISDPQQSQAALQIAESHQCNNLSFETNDPATKDSRIYVGNIAKHKVQRPDLYVIFSRYGIITAISHLTSKSPTDHCAFAFVQYSTTDAAEKAVLTENNCGYYGYSLDVKLAEFSSSPAQRQVSVPEAQQNGAPGVSVSVGQPVGPTGGGGGGMLIKRAASVNHQNAVPQPKRAKMGSNGPGDILVCGACHQSFDNIELLIRHKRTPCRPKKGCFCADENIPEVLTCGICYKQLATPWQLIKHVTSVHHVMICQNLTGQTVDGGDTGTYPVEGDNMLVADPEDGGVYEGDDENQAMLDLDNDLMEEEL